MDGDNYTLDGVFSLVAVAPFTLLYTVIAGEAPFSVASPPKHGFHRSKGADTHTAWGLCHHQIDRGFLHGYLHTCGKSRRNLPWEHVETNRPSQHVVENHQPSRSYRNLGHPSQLRSRKRSTQPRHHCLHFQLPQHGRRRLDFCTSLQEQRQKDMLGSGGPWRKPARVSRPCVPFPGVQWRFTTLPIKPAQKA